MALYWGEDLRASASSAFQYLSYRQFGVVVNRLRHAAEKSEGRKMAIAKSFRRLVGYALTKQASDAANPRRIMETTFLPPMYPSASPKSACA